jgi:hypothetical protein
MGDDPGRAFELITIWDCTGSPTLPSTVENANVMHTVSSVQALLKGIWTYGKISGQWYQI